MVVSLELWDTAYVRAHPPKPPVVETSPAVPSQTLDQKDDGVSFNWCGATDQSPLPAQIVILTNVPADMLIAYRVNCPPKWSLSGMLHANSIDLPTPSSLVAQRKVDIGFLLLIALQWILVGGRPLKGPRRWWAEPGMFITICAVLSAVLYFIPPLELLVRLPAAFASLTWLCWFALLVWRAIRSAWKWTTRRRATASN
jgi:hypothetical protein